MDLIFHRGHLIDPACNRDGVYDIGVQAGRIAAVERDLSHLEAVRHIDAGNSLVTPGLLDLHTHVWTGASYWGTNADAIAWRTGVTTWIDAGSAGAYTIDGLCQHVINKSRVRIRALLNISAIGLTGRTGEHRDLENLDIDLAERTAAEYGDYICGVKVRIDTDTVGTNGLAPLERAINLADRLQRPLMVHIGYGPPTASEILSKLRKEDILTHCASGTPTDLINKTAPSDAVLAAHDSGVLFDLGHGSGSFDFEVLEMELAAGIKPIISSDLHAGSLHGPAFDLPSVMSKMLAVGWSLGEVIEATTARPAAALNLESAGRLLEGSPADIAMFNVEEGSFPVVDVHGKVRKSPLQLRNIATYVGGSQLPPVVSRTPSWIDLSEAQAEADYNREQQIRSVTEPQLVSPNDFGAPMVYGRPR